MKVSEESRRHSTAFPPRHSRWRTVGSHLRPRTCPPCSSSAGYGVDSAGARHRPRGPSGPVTGPAARPGRERRAPGSPQGTRRTRHPAALTWCGAEESAERCRGRGRRCRSASGSEGTSGRTFEDRDTGPPSRPLQPRGRPHAVGLAASYLYWAWNSS